MSKFFSFITNGDGNPIYFDWALRKKCIKGELDYSPDLYTSIADYFGIECGSDDKLNRYRFNPLTRKLTIDRLNTEDDSAKANLAVRKLDFKDIVPALIIKPIVHPFKLNPPKRITKKHIDLLRKWSSNMASLEDSVETSIDKSVGSSVRFYVWESIWNSVEDLIWESIRKSMGDTLIGVPGWTLIWDSVGASVYAYVSSHFNVKYKHDPGPYNDLWNIGLVPSFDGNVWRLHGGKKAKILWEGNVTDTEGGAALDDLLEAINKFRSECENPAKDYAYMRVCRERMFRKHDALLEETRGNET